MRRRSLIWLVALVLSVGVVAQAANVGEMLVKTVAVGAVVNAVAKPANAGINKLVGGNGPGVSTKVVPVLSMGEKGYVGAAQVAGSPKLVGQTKAVIQLEKDFADRQYRIKLLMPISSTNPLNAKRVRGVGISGLLDVALSHNSYLVPPSVGWNAGDVLKAGAIAVATKEFGPQINGSINTMFKNEASIPDGSTKVVPYLDVGTKAHIGMMQVAGPADRVSKVKAVWQYDQLFDSGRVRLRALVPSDSVNPLSIHRVKGVGCTALIDAVVLRTKEAERAPDHYVYFQRAPVFVGLGEDPHYRPPGWDRGRKVGWEKHGNPLMPPGQAKKATAPVIIVPAPKKDQKKWDRGTTMGEIERQFRIQPAAPGKDKAKAMPPGQAKKLDRLMNAAPKKADKDEKSKGKDNKGKGRGRGRGD
jgi:hypothetical protein